MSLHLHFSNRFEPLLAELSDVLDDCWTDFGAPSPVVVPSPAVAKWLKLRLCERRGPLVGLPTPTLEAFLWGALDPDPGMTILRADALQQALIPLLDERRLARPGYATVREYLCPRSGIDVRRRCQLAQAVARLFLEYEYNRPSVWKGGAWGVKGLDQSWPDQAYFAKLQEDETTVESWQRDLHGAVFAGDGPLAETGRLGLPRLHRLRREGGWVPKGDAAMVFGVEKVSHFHRNLLLELSEAGEIHLFLVNPCAEFWEDVDTSRRGRRRSFAFPRFTEADYQVSGLSESLYPDGAKDLPKDPLLLQRWGRSPRESLALWSQAVDYNFDFLVEPPMAQASQASVLRVLQQAVTQRHPGPVFQPLELEDGQVLSGAMDPDPSLVLLDCPERGREMEAVRDQIVQWLSEDPGRMVSDAVVLMPDPAKHRSAIHRVFGATAPGEPGHLPWVVLGGTAGESQWARAVESLFQLAKGQWDRPTVFGLLRNRLVQERLKVDAATVARWENWAELSGMVRGWDADHRRELGDSPESALDPHTFRAGLLRLLLWPLADREFALGMKAPAGLEERIPTTRDFDAQPAEIEVFAACLERLFHDARGLSKRCQDSTPDRTVASLVSLFDSWVGFDDEAEARVRRSLLEGLELLAIQEGAGRQRISLEEIEETVKSLLDGELPASARAFAGSLTFAPLKSGHVLPHGLVVLAGFDAQAFPGDGMRTTLDLLATSPLVGDADALRDNRALFLHAVLSARSRLVVGWIGRDIQKDERLEPSSVVLELEEALQGVTGSSLRRRVRLLARESLASMDETIAQAPLISWDPLDRIDPVAPLREPWKAPAEDVGKSVRISISDLKSFLTDSFSHHLRRTLGWEEDESPETLDSFQETIATTPLDDAIWRTRLLPNLAELVWRGEDPSRGVQALVRRFVSTAAWDTRFPEAVLASAAMEELLAWANSMTAWLQATRLEYPAHRLVCMSDLSLGIPGRPAALELEVDGRKALVTGKIACALVPTLGKNVSASPGNDPVVLLHCVKLKGLKTKPSTVEKSRTVGAQLQAMALAASGCGFPVTIRFLAREPDVKPADVPGLVATAEWLETVVGDMLRQECQFLPSDVLLDSKLTSPLLVGLREKIDDSEFVDKLVELFEPDLPGEEQGGDDALMALAERRLGPFLEVAHGK